MVGKLKLFFIVLTLGFCPIISFGQDVHFSTFNANPMFLNPANTAFGSNLFRIGTIYRNQWSTVSSGYHSYLLSAEVLPYSCRIKRHGIGLGINFLTDIAGTLRYGQQNIGLSLSYFKAIDDNRDHYISFGLQTNTTGWGYNLANAVFGRNPEDAEGIFLNNIRTFDFGLGIHWQMNYNNKHNLQAGLSFLHINQPNLSYYETEDIILPIKINAYMSDLITISYNYSLNPSIFVQNQGRFLEFVVGTDYNINLSETVSSSKILSFGAYYRVVDAMILMAKYRFNDFQFGISYDINLSRLTPASNTYGGVEIWLLYGFNPISYKKSRTNIPCPAF